MSKGKATREEAVAWMALGHKARPREWSCGYVKLVGGAHIDENGMRTNAVACFATGWTRLGKRRIEREARIAELEKELAAMTAEADRQRARAKEAERIAAERDVESGDANHAADIATTELVRLRGELADVKAKLEASEASKRELAQLCLESEAGRPRFQRGDKVCIPYATMGNPNRVWTVHGYWPTTVTLLADDNEKRNVREAVLQPVPEPKPEPEWTPCSAAEAREKLANGFRVKRSHWKDTDYFQSKPGFALVDCSGNTEERHLHGLATDRDEAGWFYAHPLPGSGT